VLVDRDTYMYMTQDITQYKTLLLKLKRHLQDSETGSPFDTSLQQRRTGSVSSESQLSSMEGGRLSVDGGRLSVDGGRQSVDGGRHSVDGGRLSGDDLAAENADLKRQLEERDRTIHLLQQQMAKYTSPPHGVASVATQASQAVTDDPHVITVTAGRG